MGKIQLFWQACKISRRSRHPPSIHPMPSIECIHALPASSYSFPTAALESQVDIIVYSSRPATVINLASSLFTYSNCYHFTLIVFVLRSAPSISATARNHHTPYTHEFSPCFLSCLLKSATLSLTSVRLAATLSPVLSPSVSV